MPRKPACIDKHRSKKHLNCNECSDNLSFTLTSLEQIDEVSQAIIDKTAEFPEWKPYYAKLVYTVTLALHEACMNAVEHGILGLGKQRKNQLLAELEEKYMPYMEAEWKKKNIGVHISVCLNAERALIGVHDDGSGFDFSQAGKPPIDDNELLGPSGRGLMMMGGMGIKLHWNQNGNTVLCALHRPDLEEIC